MGHQKITGSQAILGGAVILNAPTIYGEATINTSITDSTKAGINMAGATFYIKKIALDVATYSTGAEVDTSFDLPDNCLVLDAWLFITTAEASGTTKTIDVGLLSTESEGDADGLLDGLVTDTAGPIHGDVVITTGSSETFFESSTYGVLLNRISVGSDAATDHGTAFKHAFNVETIGARSVSVTVGSSDCDDLVGNLYLLYVVLT